MLTGWWKNCERHPLFMCAFRPFFLATALAGAVFIAWWLLFLMTGRTLPATPGGPFVWHAHEMLFGFTYAAAAGFALTAIPEFTSTTAVTRRAILILFMLWLAARLFWLISASSFGITLTAICELAFVAGIILLIAPRIWRDPGRRQLSFLWALIALFAVTLGFYIDIWRCFYPMRWLWLCSGLMMVLIIVAMSRISMRMVNSAIEEAGIDDIEYRARPPRRNLAIFCICLYSGVEFLVPQHPVSGWVALAASAALFNLTNDWFVGRALLRRWVLMLCSAYAFMALGYGVIGLSILGDGLWVSAGRHLLLVGAIGVAVFVVMNIAGRVHTGVPPDERWWVPFAGCLFTAAALSRVATPLFGSDIRVPLAIAALCWITAYALHAVFHWPTLTGPRMDRQTGCAGIADEETD